MSIRAKWAGYSIVEQGHEQSSSYVIYPKKRMAQKKLREVIDGLGHGTGRRFKVIRIRADNPGLRFTTSAKPKRRRNNGVSYRVIAVARHGTADLARDFPTKTEAKEFARKVSSRDYFRPHIKSVAAGTNPGAELMVMAANPRVEVVHGENPPVEEIAEAFSGTEVEFLDVYNEPHMPRGRYAYLGELLSLHIKPAKGGQVQRISFSSGSDAPIVVTDSTAKQIYFVNGNQDITEALAVFGAQSRIGDSLLELGVGRRIDYKARKEHVADPDEDKWKHDHGEEDGIFPTVLFDTRNKKLLYEGGNYRIEGPWIRN